MPLEDWHSVVLIGPISASRWRRCQISMTFSLHYNNCTVQLNIWSVKNIAVKMYASYAHARARAQVHTLTYTVTHTVTHTHAATHTHSHIHTHTHTHIHTHTHMHSHNYEYLWYTECVLRACVYEYVSVASVCFKMCMCACVYFCMSVYVFMYAFV